LSLYIKGDSAAQNIVSILPEYNKGLFLWLIDLVVQTLRYRQENKMEPKELAIICANLMLENNALPDDTTKLESAATILYYIISKQCGDPITTPKFDKTELLTSKME